MIKQLLTASAIPARAGLFPDPPKTTYAIYFDDVTATGADPGQGPDAPYVYRHDGMIELYEPTPDPAAEARLEAQLRARGLSWTKQGWHWLEGIRRGQVIYEFSIISKS